MGEIAAILLSAIVVYILLHYVYLAPVLAPVLQRYPDIYLYKINGYYALHYEIDKLLSGIYICIPTLKYTELWNDILSLLPY